MYYPFLYHLFYNVCYSAGAAYDSTASESNITELMEVVGFFFFFLGYRGDVHPPDSKAPTKPPD